MNNSGLKIAVINVDFEDSSAGALARQLYYYGKDKGHVMYAFYGRGEKVKEDNVFCIDNTLEVIFHKVMTLLTGNQGYYSKHATKLLLEALNKSKIDVVILIQIHGYYINEPMLFEFLKENKIKTIYITSDEYAGLGKCCYHNDCDKYKFECKACNYISDYPQSLFFDKSNRIWKMKRNAYDGMDIVFIGPKTNIEVFKNSSLLKNRKLVEADWGINIDKYKFCEYDDLYEKYNIPRNKKYILTVAPFSQERKGVKRYFLEVAKKMSEEFHFINVGFDIDKKSIELPNNFTAIPFIKDQSELVKFYSLSDLYVLASVQDTQPLSLLFALSCGTPVCCFYVSGLKYLNPNDNEIIKYSKDITVEGLSNIIMNINKKNSRVSKKCRDYIIEKYSDKLFSERVFNEIYRMDK